MSRIVFLLLAAVATARADVVFEEPTQRTCGRADVIVAGIVEGTTAPGPFTNRQPPTVKVTATECWKGCASGDRLQVAEWVASRPSHSGKPRPSDPAAEQATWEAATVEPPAAGTSVMLFLRREGAQLVRVQDSGGYGGYVMLVGASDAQIQRSAAMCQLSAAITGERDRTATAGQPVPVHVVVTNTSGTPAVFHAEAIALTLQTDTQPGEERSPTWTPPGPMPLAPGEQRTLDWDLAALFPGAFVHPGAYWLTLDAPAALGQHWIAITVR